MEQKRSNQLCACGCGEYTLVSNQTSKRRKIKKGEPNKYLYGHIFKKLKGKNHYMWNGGIIKDFGGYVLILQKDHPRANHLGYIHRSHFIAEKALGKILPNNAVVHHVDEDTSNDDPKNLVVCENNKYHFLLHQRARALKACGHANWRKCPFCKEYDDPKNLYISPAGRSYHKKCYNKKRRKSYAKNKEKINKRQRELYAEKKKTV